MQKTGRGGRSVLAPKTPNSMLKTLLPISMQFSIYRGAIDCSEHNRTQSHSKTDGNVYYLSLSLLKDAKRK
jgi:hypothetical protein